MVPMDIMNSAAAAKTNLLYSMAAINGQNGNQDAMNVTGEETNVSLFSGYNPIHRQLNADFFLDSIMVDGFLNADAYNSQAPLQPLPTTYPSNLQTEYQYNMLTQQFNNGYHPALTLPASASALNPNMACMDSNLATLMPSNGNPDDTIDLEQILVDFRIVNPVPRNPCIPMSNALTTVPMPIHGYNQLIQIQDQQFLLQSHISSFTNSSADASDGVTQMRKRRRRLNQEEAIHCKRQRMLRNRDSAARSRARKLARDTEMQNELTRLQEENDKLKKMLEEATETRNGHKSVRTNSWS